jgi:predicted PurR-regulated permease PerM
MDWQLVAPTVFESLLLVVALMLIAAIVFLVVKVNRLSKTLEDIRQSHEHELSRLEALANNANNQQSESQARSLVITRHLQSLEEKQTELENQLREQKMQDPSLRLYQRAAELVKQGASIDEIIEACDIPRAEAEMLMMVHSQNPE